MLPRAKRSRAETLAKADGKGKKYQIAMGSKPEYIQISTTLANRSDAERVAKILAGKKLSACVQISGPVTSIYRWKGKIEKSKEWLCVIKTRSTLYKSMEKAIKSVHPYELPEIIAVPIIEGSKEYLDWIRKEVSEK